MGIRVPWQVLVRAARSGRAPDWVQQHVQNRQGRIPLPQAGPPLEARLQEALRFFLDRPPEPLPGPANPPVPPAGISWAPPAVPRAIPPEVAPIGGTFPDPNVQLGLPEIGPAYRAVTNPLPPVEPPEALPSLELPPLAPQQTPWDYIPPEIHYLQRQFPEPAPGMTRLYRGEGVPNPNAPPDPALQWLQESPEFKALADIRGRWFANTLDEAQWYAKDAPGKSRITYVDLPATEAEQYLVKAGSPEARYQARGKAADAIEYFLPPELAAKAREWEARLPDPVPGRLDLEGKFRPKRLGTMLPVTEESPTLPFILEERKVPTSLSEPAADTPPIRQMVEGEEIAAQKDLYNRTAPNVYQEATEAAEEVRRQQAGLPVQRTEGTFQSPLGPEALFQEYDQLLQRAKAKPADRALMARILQKRGLRQLRDQGAPVEGALEYTPEEVAFWRKFQRIKQALAKGSTARPRNIVKQVEGWMTGKGKAPGARASYEELTEAWPPEQAAVERMGFRTEIPPGADETEVKRTAEARFVEKDKQQRELEARWQRLNERPWGPDTMAPWDRQVAEKFQEVFGLSDGSPSTVSADLWRRYEALAKTRSFPEDREPVARAILEMFDQVEGVERAVTRNRTGPNPLPVLQKEIENLIETQIGVGSLPDTSQLYSTVLTDTGELYRPGGKSQVGGEKGPEEKFLSSLASAQPKTSDDVGITLGTVMTADDFFAGNRPPLHVKQRIAREIAWSNKQREAREKTGALAPQPGTPGNLPRRVIVEGRDASARREETFPTPVGSPGDLVRVGDRKGTLLNVIPADRVDMPVLGREGDLNAELNTPSTIVKADPRIPRLAVIRFDDGTVLPVRQELVERIGVPGHRRIPGEPAAETISELPAAVKGIRQLSERDQKIVDAAETRYREALAEQRAAYDRPPDSIPTAAVTRRQRMADAELEQAAALRDKLAARLGHERRPAVQDTIGAIREVEENLDGTYEASITNQDVGELAPRTVAEETQPWAPRDSRFLKKAERGIPPVLGPSARIVPMQYDMPASLNIWGKNTTTFDAAVAGDRIATTRHWGKKGPPKVGDTLVIQSPKGEQFQARVTDVIPITPDNARSKTFWDQWSMREGWKSGRFPELEKAKNWVDWKRWQKLPPDHPERYQPIAHQVVWEKLEGTPKAAASAAPSTAAPAKVPPPEARITAFRGDHAFLSNFSPARVTYEGQTYPSVEVAYQAAKFPKGPRRDEFMAEVRKEAVRRADKYAGGPGTAFGRLHRSGTYGVFDLSAASKVMADPRKGLLSLDEAKAFREGRGRQVMEELLQQKFKAGSPAAKKLLDTGTKWLAEGNKWGDKFWGVDATTLEGENLLGKLLEAQRDRLRGGSGGMGLPGKALALVGLTAAGLLAPGGPGEGESEAGGIKVPWKPFRTPVKASTPEMTRVITQQMSPVMPKPTQQLDIRFGTALLDIFKYTSAATNQVRKALGIEKFAPYEETAPDVVTGSRVRGGLGPMEKIAAHLGEVIRPMPTEMKDKLRAILNLKGYAREWRVVEEKIADAETLAAKLYAAGDEEGSKKAYQDAADLRRNVADGTVVPEGLTPDRIAELLDQELAPLNPNQRAWIDEATNRIFRTSRALLDWAYQEGGITNAEYSTYISRGDDYIPLPRLMEAYDPTLQQSLKETYLLGTPGKASRVRLGMTDFSLLDKELRGSARVNRDPLEAAVQMMEGMVNDVQRNAASREFLEFFHKFQDKVEPRMQMVVRRTTEGQEPPPGFQKVAYLKRGVPEYFEVNEDLARVMHALDSPDVINSIQIVKNLRQLYHTTAAGANLRFIFKQLSGLDVASAALLTNFGKHSGKHWGPVMTKFLPTYFRGITALYVGKLARQMKMPGVLGWADNLLTRYEDELAKSGFVASGASAEPLGPRGGQFRDVAGFYEEALRKNPRPLLTLPREGLLSIQRGLLEPNELAVKYATFSTLKGEGFGTREAAAMTREFGGSPDWNKWGSLTKKAQNHVMFIGPTMASMDRAVKAFREHPKTFAQFLLAMVAADQTVDEWNSQFEDEEGKPAIRHVDRNTRLKNFVILTGEKEQASTGETRYATFKWPKPYEAISFLTPVMSLKFGMEDEDYTVLQGFADAMENWIPGGGSLKGSEGITGLGGSVLKRFAAGANPLYKFPVELWTNKNFVTDAPIVGSKVEGRLSPYEGTQYTDPTAVAISRGIDSAFGKSAPEFLTSPPQLQHILNSVIPGFGEQLLSLGRPFVPPNAQTAAGVQSPTEELLHTPIIGPVMRTWWDPGTQSQQRSDKMQKFIGARKEFQEAATTANALQRVGDRQGYSRLKPEILAMAQRNPELARVSSQLSNIVEARERVWYDESLTPADRQQRIKALWDQERRLLDYAADLAKRLAP